MKALATCLLLVGLVSPAMAQDVPAPPPPPAPVPVDGQAIDATKLGVDLARIQRGLRIAESREKMSADGLRLDISIQVYGQTPRVDILGGIDLVNGAVPGTAPSHRQVIEFLTPPIYRQPGVDFFGLAIIAVQKLVERGNKAHCEREIAAYRELLMQGVNVAAPRCTQ
jgi:hypothetical protein